MSGSKGRDHMLTGGAHWPISGSNGCDHISHSMQRQLLKVANSCFLSLHDTFHLPTFIPVFQFNSYLVKLPFTATLPKGHLYYSANTVTCGDRKQCFIIYLCFNPVHKQGNILGSWQCCRFLVLPTISPQILKFWSTWHRRTCCCSAVLWHSSIY